jgi:circadian clock protein KaiC
MPHSNQVREFLITSKGVSLIDAIVGPGGVAIGSARLRQEAEAAAARGERAQEISRKDRALERRRKRVEAQIDALRADLAAEEDELKTAATQNGLGEAVREAWRARMRQSALATPAARSVTSGRRA